MSEFFWDFDFEPDYPLTVLKFSTDDSRNTLHWHNYLQICLCTGGSGKFIFTSREYPVEQGDVFIVGNFENHVAVPDPAGATHYLFVIFLPEFIAYPGSRLFDFEYLYPFRYNPESFDHKIAHGTRLAKELGEIMLEMEPLLREKPTGYRHLLDAALRRALALLIRHYKAVYPDYYYADKNHAKIQEALEYINSNFQNHLTLEDLSERFFLSKSRFGHIFKETVRIGFKEYLTYLRLTNARRLLVTTEMSISDIASQTGFTNISQFYKVFRQYVFLTPAEYRKRYGQAERPQNGKNSSF